MDDKHKEKCLNITTKKKCNKTTMKCNLKGKNTAVCDDVRESGMLMELLLKT